VHEILLTEKAEDHSDVEERYANIINYTISTGDIPAEVFSAQGKLDANDTVALLLASKEIYDFTNIKVGRTLRFYFKNENRPTRIEYDRDTERVIVVERSGDDFSAREEKINYTVSQEIASGTIDNFFYVDAMEAGLSESTVLEVGDIFSFDIDFTTEIQTGDSFSIIYEKRLREGEKAPDGKILAGKFTNVSVPFYAYYFDNNGKGGYYDGDGRVLERQFLKAPLSYRHISSGFTGARMHPITRKVSAHFQIDYAAPSGTPVVASARGTVISAGWSAGWGNMVRLEHDNGYTTHYGHLSAFAKGLRAEAKVERGQLIGYVGSTGWSTGPHLDYGIKLNGTPVNPLKLDMPKGEPLGGDSMKQFEEIKNKYVDLLK
jgi:murein DD-endopeptidase MepM/ murein hydrolase activator NlpD